MKDIRVVTVDNFQGEENEIILLSLVRSNESNRIGFLEISNRVCVALSRARLGMYIFGNAECLRDHSPNKSKEVEHQERLWLKVIEKLIERKEIDNALTLKCENHKKIYQRRQNRRLYSRTRRRLQVNLQNENGLWACLRFVLSPSQTHSLGSHWPRIGQMYEKV